MGGQYWNIKFLTPVEVKRTAPVDLIRFLKRLNLKGNLFTQPCTIDNWSVSAQLNLILNLHINLIFLILIFTTKTYAITVKNVSGNNASHFSKVNIKMKINISEFKPRKWFAC